MKGKVPLLVVVCFVGLFLLSCGCTSSGDPDQQFRDAWNQSEAALLPHVTNISRLAEAEDFPGLADEAEAMIATIDTYQSAVSRIRVSDAYSPGKETYLEGLKELRSAATQLRDIDEKSMIDQYIDLYIAQERLDTATSRMDEVRAMMG